MEYLEKLTAIIEEGKRPDFTMLLDRVAEPEEDVIPSPGLKEGLKAYFKRFKLPEGPEARTLEDLEQYYRNLSAEYGYEVDIPEFALIRQGGRLEDEGRLAEAEVLYQYALEHYPHNLNSYHRLAELMRRKGDYGSAILFYERFLERRAEPFFEQRLNSLRRYVNESAAYAVEGAIEGSGTDAGTERYRELRSDDEARFYFDETEFNALGYKLLSRRMTAAAIEVFKMNVEMYPESANAYDSLGEAYMLDGDTGNAVRNYMRSLELNPDNTNAKEKLEELGDATD
jgi:tetratricopeptide (TPR) repeat protein